MSPKSARSWSITTDPDIKKLRSDIKELGPDGKKWAKALGKANKASADVIAATGRQIALAMGGVQARAASRIQGSASAQGLRIRVSKSAAHPEALAAFWGMKKKTGWYGDLAHLASTTPQTIHPWVGNTWKVGDAGEGPYAINDAIAERVDDVVESWAEAIDQLARAAGFN